MPGNTVTRAQLSEAVYQEVGLSRNESAELVESILSEMSQTLSRGEMVKISSFGSFFPCAAKVSVSAAIQKPARKYRFCHAVYLCFGPSHVLKNRVNSRPSE